MLPLVSLIYVFGLDGAIQKVLRLCGGRRVVFDNRTKDEGVKAKQVHELLVHVAAIERETGGNPFTDTMHRRIQVKL